MNDSLKTSVLRAVILTATMTMTVAVGAGAFAADENTPNNTTGKMTGNEKPASPYKAAREACLKEKPDLKGKDLRTCVTKKELAAKNSAGEASGTSAGTSPSAVVPEKGR